MRLFQTLVAFLLFSALFSANALLAQDPTQPVCMFTGNNLIQDLPHDVEPTITRIQNNTVVAAVKYVDPGNDQSITPRIYYQTKNATTTCSAQLPLPQNMTQSGDPVLYKSLNTGPYSNRVYLCGLVSNNSGASGIALWCSTDGGMSWTTPPKIVASSTMSDYVLDKPTVTVSWSTIGQGHVYVSFLQKNALRNATGAIQLYAYGVCVARSTDGGQSFDQYECPYMKTTSASAFGINDPQIIVAKHSTHVVNGFVYVSWVDYDLKRIFLARSPWPDDLRQHDGEFWLIEENGPTGNFNRACAQTVNGLKALTIPMMRFNEAAIRICFVWHEYIAGTQRSTTYFASTGTDSWATSPTGSTSIPLDDADQNGMPDNNNIEQFMPALAIDNAGNVIVTYYDRIWANTPSLYGISYIKVNARGGRLGPPTRLTPLNSDVSKVRNLDQQVTNCSLTHFIGDYMDLWFDAGSFYSAWIGTPSGQSSDVVVSSF